MLELHVTRGRFAVCFCVWMRVTQLMREHFLFHMKLKVFSFYRLCYNILYADVENNKQCTLLVGEKWKKEDCHDDGIWYIQLLFMLDEQSSCWKWIMLKRGIVFHLSFRWFHCDPLLTICIEKQCIIMRIPLNWSRRIFAISVE